MQFLPIILKFITNPKNREFLMIAGCAVMIMLLFRQCGEISDLEQKNDQNIKALSEQTQVLKNKDNEITYQKTLVVGSSKDLKALQGKYADLQKELKKERDRDWETTKVF